MEVLFENNPAFMLTVVVFLVLGAVLVLLGTTGGVIKTLWAWFPAPDSTGSRIVTFAAGAVALAVGLALGLLAYQGSPNGNGNGGTDPLPSPSPSPPSSTGSPSEPPSEEVAFTIGAGPDLVNSCRDLDVPGTAFGQNAWDGLCARDNILVAHNGYGLTLWEEDGLPGPMDCVAAIGQYYPVEIPVAVGSLVCVATGENRVALLTVDDMSDGITLSGPLWGPLVY